MLKKATIQHLRIPFSFFLLPVFLFALGNSASINLFDTVLSFFIVHFLLYPATNGYNSYFDKDEKSIGGLRYPPPVDKELYWTSLALDILAILLGLLINFYFSVMIFLYGLASKAYSHPSVRLKKYALTGWFIAGFFQGLFTYLTFFLAIGNLKWKDLFVLPVIIPAGLCTLLLWGSYPMTQIYQHEEDYKRGDITISFKLGILKTFVFSAVLFLVANISFILYFLSYQNIRGVLLFEFCLVPMMVYFIKWFAQCLKNPALADYSHTMRLNLVSSVSLNLFFLVYNFL